MALDSQIIAAQRKAEEKMTACVRLPSFFPRKLQRKDKKLASALDNSLPYPEGFPNVEREEYLDYILRMAKNRIGWCVCGMKDSDPMEMLADSYKLAVRYAPGDPIMYLAKTGYETFMKELGIERATRQKDNPWIDRVAMDTTEPVAIR